MDLKTKDWLCDYLAISGRTIEMWVKEGKLPPPIQPGGKGGKVYFDLEAVNAYLGRAIASNKTNKALN